MKTKLTWFFAGGLSACFIAFAIGVWGATAKEVPERD